MRKALLVTLAAAALAAYAAPATPVSAAKPFKPVVVATDPPDDWGEAAGVPAAAGTPLSMELVEASIGMSDDRKDILFIIKLAGPSSGGVPELVRWGWELTVDGDPYQINGGRTELIRGMCNPLITDPACPPNVGDPAKLTSYPFFVRSGTCTAGSDCTVHAVVNAAFDVAAGTITIPVPLEAVEAKLGSTIGPMGGTFGAIYAAPGALVTTNALPHDAIALTKPMKLPKK